MIFKMEFIFYCPFKEFVPESNYLGEDNYEILLDLPTLR
jgi:hypothetical protein